MGYFPLKPIITTDFPNFIIGKLAWNAANDEFIIQWATLSELDTLVFCTGGKCLDITNIGSAVTEP